jgi:hypothetical protein
MGIQELNGGLLTKILLQIKMDCRKADNWKQTHLDRQTTVEGFILLTAHSVVMEYPESIRKVLIFQNRLLL